MKNTLITIIASITMIFASCTKEEINPTPIKKHNYEYIVYGTSGSYNIAYQEWNKTPLEDRMIYLYSNIGNSFSIRWSEVDSDRRLLSLQAVSNNSFGYVTVEVKKDGFTLLRKTASGLDTARVQIMD